MHEKTMLTFTVFGTLILALTATLDLHAQEAVGEVGTSDELPVEPEVESPAATVETAAQPPAAESSPVTEDDRPQVPLSQPRGSLTLEEAQRIALDRNPSLRASAQEIERARALVRQAWAAVFPNLGLNIQYQMADQPTVVSFDTGMGDLFGEPQEIVVAQQHVARLGLTARQPIFNGQTIPGIQIANESFDLSELTVDQARRQTSIAVVQAFYSVISARRTLELIDRTIELAQEDVAAARARLEAQAGLAINVARSELQVEQSRSQRVTTLLGYENARDALALLMGVPPEELPELAEPQPPSGSGMTEIEELVEQARTERLDIRAGRRQIRMAELDRNRVWLSFAPSLDLTWGLSHTLTDLGGFGDRRTSWNLILVLNFPLFDGGFRYGQLRDARARMRQAELAQEALEQSVAVEVRQAFRAWRSSLESIDIARRQLELARQAHRLARASYAAGAASNLEVVDAQRTLASAEVDVELRRLSAQLSLIELISRLEVGASGGGGASMGGGR